MINRNYPPVYKCKKCQEYKPKPKPKDRIEPLSPEVSGCLGRTENIYVTRAEFNRLIRHINKES